MRPVYSGKITYAANWSDDLEAIAFWDALDCIGIQAYFPISDQDDPPPHTLPQGWTRHLTQIEALQQKTGKPIVFTELGYRSVGYAAREPWTWPRRGESAAPAPQLQADLYAAAFATFFPKPWFEGVLLWKWHPPGEMGDRRTLSFTPQGKPAEAVMADWFRP